MKPRVSIIMPVYNASPFLRQALESILNQSFRDFECLIIDDCSSDGSWGILQQVQDPRVVIRRHTANKGVTPTLNELVDWACGDFIARMDADDVMHNERIRLQLDFMTSHHHVAGVFSLAELIDSEGNSFGEWNSDQASITSSGIRRNLAKSNCLVHPTAFFRAEVLKKMGYRHELNAAEDYDLWLRCTHSGLVLAKINRHLLQYRIHQLSVTAKVKIADNHYIRVFRQKKFFLKYALFTLKWNTFFWRVVYTSCRSYAGHVKWIVPKFLRSIKRWLTVAPWTVMGQSKAIEHVLNKQKWDKIFFFPYTHLGGAERVHADIVNVFSGENNIVLFTNFSQDSNFVNQFECDGLEIINLPECLHHPMTRNRIKRCIVDLINTTPNIKLVGANSAYFLEILPWIKPDVVAVDLTHAFKFQPNANLPHLGLLPFALRLNHRVFISLAAMEEYKKFLRHHFIGPEIVNRLLHIENGTTVPIACPIKTSAFQVVFVARNSPAKRFKLFDQIAKSVLATIPDVTFVVAGFDAVPADSRIVFCGELNDQELGALYCDAHAIVVCSSREGMPLVLLEAMANGVVPVVTNVGDIPRHISHDKGFMTEAQSDKAIVDELSNAIISLANNSELRQRMSSACYEYAKTHFSRSVFQAAYWKLLNERISF
jgi:L-malate glycosyltransferase